MTIHTSGAPRRAAKKEAKPVRTFPPTALMVMFKELKVNGFNKAERKSRVSQYIMNEVDEVRRNPGRLASHTYDPAAYKVELKKLREIGELVRGFKNDSFTPEQVESFNAGTGEQRKRARERLGTMRGVDTAGAGNKNFFLCTYTNFLTTKETRVRSIAANRWANNIVVANGTWRVSEAMDDKLPREIAVRFAPTAGRFEHGDFDWITSEYADSQGLMYAGHQQCYMTPEMFEELGVSLFGKEPIGSYHSSKQIVGKIPSAKYDGRKLPLRMGLELEVENATLDTSTTALACEWLKKFGLITIDGRKYRYSSCEHDGSLGNGFECVTGYTGLDTHAIALAPLKDAPFKGKLKSHDTTTCGLHVHIDRANMTPLHAYKLNVFINAKANLTLMYAIARRYNHDRYAAMAPKEGDGRIMGSYVRETRAELRRAHGGDTRTMRREFSTLMKARYREIIGKASQGKYQAVNFTPSKTVEFRLFRGSLRYETIMACLEFTRAAWLFSQERSQAEMVTSEFIKFICREDNRGDTKHLREYLTLKGFATKERTAYTVPENRISSMAVIQSEDPAFNLPAPPKHEKSQLQPVAA